MGEQRQTGRTRVLVKHRCVKRKQIEQEAPPRIGARRALALQPRSPLMAAVSSFPPRSVTSVTREAPSHPNLLAPRNSPPLSLWIITTTHKVTVEPSPASHRAHLMPPQHHHHPPPPCPRCLCVGLLPFHYLFGQIGLWMVCGGSILTRDGQLRGGWARC